MRYGPETFFLTTTPFRYHFTYIYLAIKFEGKSTISGPTQIIVFVISHHIPYHIYICICISPLYPISCHFGAFKSCCVANHQPDCGGGASGG